jgi:hypothetical protein
MIEDVHANGQERLGTFESERSTAFERILENVHGTVTFQKRKNYCISFKFLQLSVHRTGNFM